MIRLRIVIIRALVNAALNLRVPLALELVVVVVVMMLTVAIMEVRVRKIIRSFFFFNVFQYFLSEFLTLEEMCEILF